MDKIQIEATIFAVMRDTLGIDVSGIARTDELARLNVDTDDWTFLFMPEIQRRLEVFVPVDAWSRASTVERMAEMFMAEDTEQLGRSPTPSE